MQEDDGEEETRQKESDTDQPTQIGDPSPSSPATNPTLPSIPTGTVTRLARRLVACREPKPSGDETAREEGKNTRLILHRRGRLTPRDVPHPHTRLARRHHTILQARRAHR